MALPVRLLYFVGAAAIVAAIAAAVLLQGMEYTSWVAGTIGALSIAAGLVVRALKSGAGDSDTGGDRVDQRKVKARGYIIGKSGGGASGDRIRQTRLDAGGDAIGKQTGPDTGTDR